MTSTVLMRQNKNIKPFYRHSGDWGARSNHEAHQISQEDAGDKMIVNSNRSYRHHDTLSVSLENFKKLDPVSGSKNDTFSAKQPVLSSSGYNYGGGKAQLRQRDLVRHRGQGLGDPPGGGEMKKSPSTPNLNWRYAMTEEPPVPGGTRGGAGSVQEQVVRRRQRKVQRPRPRSEIREKTCDETWIDGERERRPASYVDTGRAEKDYYVQTCKKPASDTKSPSLPRPVLSGLVWHQNSGLFSRWREVFLILTRDCLRCHKISGSAKTAQFGGLLFSVDLVLVTDVRYVERRGYLTLCLEGQGLSRTYLRRTEGIREWGKLIMECVKRKKDEFERDMSPCNLLRYPRPLMQLQPDSWLLSRLSPNTIVQKVQTKSPLQLPGDVMETETDSGLDSLEESERVKEEAMDREIEVEEMQEVKLNIRGGKCFNMTGRAAARPKIPTRLCKVTRV